MVDAYFWKFTVARGKLWADSGEGVGYRHIGTFHVVESDIVF